MNRSVNTKKTLHEWELYINTLEKELHVRTTDSNMLTEVVEEMITWESGTPDPSSYTKQANTDALRRIRFIVADRMMACR